jgi:hypothetical protein
MGYGKLTFEVIDSEPSEKFIDVFKSTYNITIDKANYDLSSNPITTFTSPTIFVLPLAVYSNNEFISNFTLESDLPRGLKTGCNNIVSKAGEHSDGSWIIGLPFADVGTYTTVIKTNVAGIASEKQKTITINWTIIDSSNNN